MRPRLLAGLAALLVLAACDAEEPRPAPAPEKLPRAVAAVRDGILEAAAEGDYGALRPLIETDTFLSDLGYGVDPLPEWEALGDRPLDLMRALLEMDFVEEDTNEGRLFRWPVYDAGTPSLAGMAAEDRKAFESVLTGKQLRRLVPDAEYGYVGPRLGILADGTWWFFQMEPGP